jgi:hypothetical protein
MAIQECIERGFNFPKYILKNNMLVIDLDHESAIFLELGPI